MSSTIIKNLDAKEIGARIKKRREELGVSQKALAEQLGFKHKSQVSNYESGRLIPRPEDLVALASIFKRSVDYILTGKYSGESVQFRVADPTDDRLKGLDRNDRQIVDELIDLLNDTDSEVRSHLKRQIRILKRKSVPAKRRSKSED